MRRERKNLTCSRMTNRKMNDVTYKLRRVVIDTIYVVNRLLDSKNLSRMPRVDVRIGDCNQESSDVLGVARMSDCIVWIPASTFARSEADIAAVIYHELLHAVYGIEHNEKCSLMSSVLQTIPTAKTQEIFLEYAEKA